MLLGGRLQLPHRRQRAPLRKSPPQMPPPGTAALSASCPLHAGQLHCLLGWRSGGGSATSAAAGSVLLLLGPARTAAVLSYGCCCQRWGRQLPLNLCSMAFHAATELKLPCPPTHPPMCAGRICQQHPAAVAVATPVALFNQYMGSKEEVQLKKQSMSSACECMQCPRQLGNGACCLVTHPLPAVCMNASFTIQSLPML